MIRRSRLLCCAARVRHQHMGLLKSEKRRKRSNNIYAKFAARTPGIGNTAGGLLAAAAHWLCRGLRIATRARPPRLTRGAAGVSLWARPRSWQGGPPGPLGDGSNRSVQSRLRTSRRTLPCRSLRQERTCRAGYEVVKVKTRLSRTKQSRPGYFERSRGRSDRRRQGCVGSRLPDGD